MPRGRCVDCGYLSRQDPRDGSWITLTELERRQLAQGRYGDESLDCYAGAEVFTPAGIRRIIDCPFYIRATLGRSPQDHLDMQEILDARRQARKDAKETRDSLRRHTWITTLVTTAIMVTAVIVAALIGRGIIWG